MIKGVTLESGCLNTSVASKIHRAMPEKRRDAHLSTREAASEKGPDDYQHTPAWESRAAIVSRHGSGPRYKRRHLSAAVLA